ncbi:mitosis inhibitor protein kinase swe1, partial [Spiromyces aspiralis]
MVHTPHRLANRHNHHYHHQRKPVGCPPCESLVSTPTTHATRLRRRTLPASLATPSPARHNGSTNSAQGGSFDARTRPAKGPISHSRQDTQHLHQLSFPLTATKVSTNLFTPPATKLVRPDPSAFASTGLVSKKNRPRPPSCASFVMPDTPCKKSPFFPGSAGATTTVFPSTLPQSFSSAAPDHYADPFRLGKHRNPSLESLKLSKKVHV